MPKRGLNDGKKLKDQVPRSNMEDARWKRCYHKVSTLNADKKKLLDERVDAFVKEKGADYLCKKGNLSDLMSREFFEHWVELLSTVEFFNIKNSKGELLMNNFTTAGMAGDTKCYIWLRVQTLHNKAHIWACFWKNKASATETLASTSSPEFSPLPSTSNFPPVKCSYSLS